jgi:hypothetical protein
MSPRLRFFCEAKRTIGIDIDRTDGIHLKRDFHERTLLQIRLIFFDRFFGRMQWGSRREPSASNI